MKIAILIALVAGCLAAPAMESSDQVTKEQAEAMETISSLELALASKEVQAEYGITDWINPIKDACNKAAKWVIKFVYTMASDKLQSLYDYLKAKFGDKSDESDDMDVYGIGSSILDKLKALIEKYATSNVCDHIITWVKLYAGNAIKTALINFVKTAIWGLIG